MSVVKTIFWQFLILVLCTGSFASILLGIGMLVRPERVERLTMQLSRWISPAQGVTEQLDRPRWIERYFYRHHRLVGSLVFFGATFVLYVFLFSTSFQKVLGSLPRIYLPIWNTVFALLVIGSVLAALVGLIVLARPSLLREIEGKANRWVSTEQAVKTANNMHHHIDEFVLKHRKLTGTIMIVGGAYILYSLGPIAWNAQLKF